MSTIVSWNLQVSIRDGRFDEFKALMQEMVDSTRTESGTLAYEWFLSEDSKSCHLYERYSDSDAVMTHLRNFGSNFADRFVDNGAGGLHPASKNRADDEAAQENGQWGDSAGLADVRGPRSP